MKRLILSLTACVALSAPVASARAEVSFQTTTLEPAGNIVEDVAVGDVDGVNGPDIVTAYFEGGIGVQLNDGHGHFGAPQMYATGCDTKQVELADVGAPGGSILPDSHLDAVVACSYGGGETIELGRMFGDGKGGFSAPSLFAESNYGSFNGLSLTHQGFALVEFRGSSGPPVPAWTRLVQTGGFQFHRLFCLSYDWSTAQCANVGEQPEPYPPLVAGRVAEAELFTNGGSEGLLDWGPNPSWHASTRQFGPEPASVDPADIWRSIAIGDLQGDGPDILTSAGTSGAVPEEPASGRVSVLFGNYAEGVPPQQPTTFPSALGVEGIATGDFDLDGHTDVVGTSWHWSPATGGIGTVFFQQGNGAGNLGAPQELPLYSGERFNYDPIRVADLDGDGTPDVVAIVGGKVQVLLNKDAAGAPPSNPNAATNIGTSSTGTGSAPGTPLVVNPLIGVTKIPGLIKALADGTLKLGTATNPPTLGVTITITLSPVRKAKGSAFAMPAQKAKKPTVIGTVHLTVPAGKTVPLKVRLSSKAREMLKKGPLHARLTLLATSVGGAKRSETKSLTIEATPKRGKKK
ncbi:MAG TPA: VCBS repeat-containing protein [Solirubrobacteraceae bacterium]|nr:VCBS repeat-containing protein [Solirubrobacteraceae bacterium]